MKIVQIDLGRLGEWALRFVKKIVEEGDVILYSDIVEDELSVFYDKEIINEILSIVDAEHLKKVLAKVDQVKEGKTFGRERHVPFGDAIHAVLARDNNATLITRDKDFNELQDIAPYYHPEDLL
jgi:predicted nucleic acid-binding protein